MVFEIIARDKNTKARIGILSTKKGKVETPFFMPVSTKGAPKYLNPIQLKELSNVTISNSFILSLRPGIKVVKKAGGLGKFMNFSGVNFTDSGGFQMYSKSFYEKANDDGVFFKNPISGEKIFMTPEQSMKIQIDIGSDVAMCLDSMPLYENSREEIEESARKTFLWAKKCKKEHDKLQRFTRNSKRQLLFGITQGGVYPDLREKSVREISSLNFDGYSIGGMGMGETKDEEYKIIEIQKSILPENKPVYLMGIGDPIEIVEGIARGVDIFDSRFPTQNARRGTLFTWKGKMKILNAKFTNDQKPIDSECDCFVCKNYSRAYVRHLLSQEEPVGKELASYHNLYFLKKLIERAKESIRKGEFEKFRKKIQKIY